MAPLELPEYTVRMHPRARRVRIRVSALDGVVVTLPPRAPRSLAEEAVASRAEWISEALARIAPRRELLLAGAEALLPAEVHFDATGESWPVRVVLGTVRATAAVRAGVLELTAPSAEDALAALRRWLSRSSRTRLLPMLAAAATEHGVAYAAAGVRFQRSRWGSYSAAGRVSLNRNLVFLPAESVRAVIVHELCHARHHDHSPAFWRELERMDPSCGDTRKALRGASERVPPWALRP